MPVQRTPMFIADKLLKAAMGRKTRQGKINVLIDAGFEDNPIVDQALHFVNEAVLHGHVKQHVRNTIKYRGVQKIVEQLTR